MLRALGVDRYPFTATGPRTRVVSDLSREHERMVVEERRRMAAASSGARPVGQRGNPARVRRTEPRRSSPDQ